MQNSFLQHEKNYEDWKVSDYPNIKQETKEFIDNVLEPNKKFKMWKHQIDGLLRTIYAYEILGKKNILLNIVTGGGKTAIIAAIIFWLKSVHGIDKFIILTPNTIVRARLRADFENASIFKKFEFATKQNQIILNELALHVMESGKQPVGMLNSGIILGNIQQMYTSHITGKRNIAYLQQFSGDIAIFNDEAHNTPAQEYTNVLNSFSKKCKFRLDTTATPNRADGQEPDSEMIQHYDISHALDDGIVKSIVVYEPEVKLLQLTYTNPETGEKKNITELDAEFKEAEKQLRSTQWILDPEPMKKQIAISLHRHREHIIRSKGRYKPILFIVTMSITEGERVQKMLQERFKIKSLLVTEESDEEDRDAALKIGTFDSQYEAVVSVLMLREGWDVPEVTTILLLRKFSSPVYGQQVIGRGLRKIIRDPLEPEILSVIDHPRLEHDWLWKLVAVSKIKQDVTDEDIFDPDDDLPEKILIQTLVKPEKIIRIPDPKYVSLIDIDELDKDIPDDIVEKSWNDILEKTTYDKERWIINRVQIDEIYMKKLRSKGMEVIDGVNDYDFEISGNFPRDILENKFKEELLNQCANLLNENGFSSMSRGKLYLSMLNHIKQKIFSNKSLSEAHYEDIEFVIDIMPEVSKNFTRPIVAGIIGDGID